MNKQTEALKLALDWFEWFHKGSSIDAKASSTQIRAAIREALAEQPSQQQKEGFASPGGGYVPAIPRPMPLDWKLVPRKATPEMLKAMDECAQEGYDERLYAGMASSVYMAAWDASPVMGTLPEQPAQQQELIDVKQIAESLRQIGLTLVRSNGGFRVIDLGRIEAQTTSPPASKPWVGLTEEQKAELVFELFNDGKAASKAMYLLTAHEAKLREKNA